MKTVKFYTLGCKVNQYDTQSIREQFLRSGFQELDNGQPADIYIINTCTVTKAADSESLNFIRRAKRENPQAKIIATGCLTELDRNKIEGIGGITLIAKNRDKDNIFNLFSHLDNNEQTSPVRSYVQQSEVSNGASTPASRQAGANERTDAGISSFKGHTRAFLKIQDGCDNFCSYCKVPLVRGVSRSKPLNEIIQEARELVKNDFKEIVLCGICLGSYGKDLNSGYGLVDVIEALEDITGLLRIRLSSIEAGDVSDELIYKMAQSQKLCRHLHIPIQSGDDKILKKMDRKYCRVDYLNLIKKIKSQVLDIAITADVLVGFPGETKINFQNTVDLVKEILPLKVHIFPYSARKGTAAANFRGELSPVMIKERTARLKKAAQACALAYKKQFLNKKMSVLIEGRAKEKPNFWEGHTDNYLKVAVEADTDLRNQLITLQLKKIDKNCIIGQL